MSGSQNAYTYRAGKKVQLVKEPDKFVVRASPEELRNRGIVDAEQVSSRSSRVTTRAPDLEPMMSRARHIAPTHHSYKMAGSGQEFLITDRIMVTFRDAMPPDQV
ncbi:MAG: S8 family serine peptidase, partial [Candidatus Binatia bacterium]